MATTGSRLAVDVLSGLLLAGLVAPVALAVLPAVLHGRAALFLVAAGCIVAARLVHRWCDRALREVPRAPFPPR